MKAYFEKTGKLLAVGQGNFKLITNEEIISFDVNMDAEEAGNHAFEAVLENGIVTGFTATPIPEQV